MLSCRFRATISSCTSSTKRPLPLSSSALSLPRRSSADLTFSSCSIRCLWCASVTFRAESSVVRVLIWVSRSPRVRCVDANSERRRAIAEGDETSDGTAAPLPLGVSGRVGLEEALGEGGGSSTVDVGWATSAAVRSASFVSTTYQLSDDFGIKESSSMDVDYLHAWIYSSCARSRTSRASSADRYSASALLMAGYTVVSGRLQSVLVLPRSSCLRHGVG